MKTLKICLGILCLLPFQAIGTPQSIGANFFMKTITINSQKHGTKTVLIDDEDFDLVSQYSWHILLSHGNYYASTHTRNEKGRTCTLMHRMLFAIKNGQHIDHINNNGLDNRRSNIRLCSISENNRNRAVRKDSTLGIKGVYLSKSRSDNSKKKFTAEIRHNKKKYSLGYFETKEQAALAYNEAAIKYHGEFARLNQIRSI